MTDRSAPRRRGRPRGATDSRARIIAAAVDEFGENGYDGSTIRSIASRAGVDSALVHHYFGTKADLFAETVGMPMRPDIDVPGILAGPRDEIGDRLVRYILQEWEKPEVRRRGVLLLRATVGSRLTTPLLTGFLTRELLSRVTAAIDAPDAELRAGLVASQIGGLLLARYVLQLPPLANASIDDVAAQVGPTLQRYLFG